MKIEHEYSGPREHAHNQIDKFLTSLQKQYGNRISNPSKFWNNSKDEMKFSFEIYGFTLGGAIHIHDGKVVLDGKVPLLARFFQGKAETLIRKKLEEIL